mmetsp:Transcript_33591/g.82562  ORF Transcript_33591/g.82562 Transcript_33591/m.82562 type:complete len:322 (-) Transcript_33591:126-1091(-)
MPAMSIQVPATAAYTPPCRAVICRSCVGFDFMRRSLMKYPIPKPTGCKKASISPTPNPTGPPESSRTATPAMDRSTERMSPRVTGLRSMMHSRMLHTITLRAQINPTFPAAIVCRLAICAQYPRAIQKAPQIALGARLRSMFFRPGARTRNPTRNLRVAPTLGARFDVMILPQAKLDPEMMQTPKSSIFGHHSRMKVWRPLSRSGDIPSSPLSSAMGVTAPPRGRSSTRDPPFLEVCALGPGVPSQSLPPILTPATAAGGLGLRDMPVLMPPGRADTGPRLEGARAGAWKACVGLHSKATRTRLSATASRAGGIAGNELIR